MTTAPVTLDFLAAQLADAEVGWSLGTFGAIAEFTRDADEMVILASNAGASGSFGPGSAEIPGAPVTFACKRCCR